MDVSIHRATIGIGRERTKLTKSVAKQFPILEGDCFRRHRVEDGKPVPRAICKVNGATLNSHFVWLILVSHPIAGLAWMAPVRKHDLLEEIPTIIL